MESDIIRLVKGYMNGYGMICRGEHVCAAVSGGADSMCLLFLLHGMAKEKGFFLEAVHVEHGIRGKESIADMDYVRQICTELEIPLQIYRIDARKISKETKTTIEEAARNERYRIFSAIDADKIALAHHKNDLAETFIFNLSRGSGIKGISGIPPVRDKFIRPLLGVSRAEIEEYCREHNIAYCHDSTNDDTDIARNRIRNIIIPEILKINEGAIEHIYDIAEDISMIEDYLSQEINRAYDRCVRTCAGKYEIDLSELNQLHDTVSTGVIKRVLKEAAGRSKDISRRHINAVSDLKNSQSGRHIDLIYGLKAYKQFDHMIITVPGKYELEDEKSINEQVPEVSYIVLDIKEIDMKDITDSGNYTKFIDYAKINNVSKLCVRHRQSGDYISIKKGNKKIKDLLIEEKIPAEKRDSLYMVVSGEEVIWIPETGRIGERFKVTDTTKKVLKMEIKNG